MTASLESRLVEIGPIAEAAAAQSASTQRLTDEVVELLRESGVFGMAMATDRGGLGLDPMTQVEAIAALAYFDPSTAWVAMICADTGYYSGYFPEHASTTIYPAADLLTSGWISPGGEARQVDDGWMVNGRWKFGSGIRHADVIVGGCLALDSGGDLISGPDGKPELRVFHLPSEHVIVHDTWHTTGLAGTGSNDYSIDDPILVPSDHWFCPQRPGAAANPLYRYHGFFFAKVVGVALGLTRRVIDEFIAIVESKPGGPPAFAPMSTDAVVQIALGQAEGDLLAMWGATERAIDAVWRAVSAGDFAPAAARADIASMLTWVMQQALQVTRELCSLVGTSAIFEQNRLEQLRRDAETMTSHIVGQRRTLQVAGQMHLGIDPAFSIF